MTYFGSLPLLAALWIILLALMLDAAIILVCIARKAPSWGLVPLVLTAVLLYLAGIDVAGAIRNHPFISLAAFAVYIPASLGYACLKAWTKSRQRARNNSQRLRQWLEQQGVQGTLEIPATLIAECREWAERTGWPEILKWREVLRDASWWALYFPIDGLYWLGAVWLPEFVRWILERPATVAKFEAIAQRHFEPVLAEYYQFQHSAAASQPGP